MGVKILRDKDGTSALYCSTSMVAFGPVHMDDDLDLIEFLEFLPKDARSYSQDDLLDKYWEWFNLQEAEPEINEDEEDR